MMSQSNATYIDIQLKLLVFFFFNLFIYREDKEQMKQNLAVRASKIPENIYGCRHNRVKTDSHYTHLLKLRFSFNGNSQ